MTTILENHQYSLDDYHLILKRGFAFEISKNVIDKICKLSELVGAPTYKKTPVFKHNPPGNKQDYRKPRQRQMITADDWEAMRNFTTTKLETAKDDIDKEIEKIRGQLNKLTDKNYSEIIEIIKNILSTVLNMNPKEDELEKVGVSIFEIGSINKFWSKLYAKLYKDLIESFPIMADIYRKNFETFISVFDSIRYVKSEEDYDLFCKFNKENERRRSLSCFFVHLMKNKVINPHEIFKIITILIQKFNQIMNIEDKKEEVGEIGENLVILIRNGIEDIEEENKNNGKKIREFVSTISSTSIKSSNYSLTRKTIFKFMDLDEEI